MAGREDILSGIPEPSWQQIQALDRTVESVVSGRGLSWAEVTQHRTAVGKLQTFVSKFLDGVRLEMFGAVNGGSALKEDAVSVSVSGNGSAHSLLVQVFHILHRHGAPEYKNVHEDFSGKGYVKAEEAESGRQFVLVVSGHSDIAAGQLFHLYFSADSRAHELAVMLRSWAQKCHLDRPEEGTLPAHAFDIMVIYFLQQITPPVLPVLQFPADAQKWLSVSDIVQQLNSQADRWWSDNRSGLGELWLQLLKFYCCQFHFACSVVSVRTKAQPTHKRWSNKRVAIEDPFQPSQNVAGSMQNVSVVNYFQSSWYRAYEYFGMPRNKEGEAAICMEHLKQLAQQEKDSGGKMKGRGLSAKKEKKGGLLEEKDGRTEENGVTERNEETGRRLEAKEGEDRQIEKEGTDEQTEENEEKDGPVEEKDGPAEEKDGPAEEKDGPVEEKDGPVDEKDILLEEKDGPVEEKDGPLEAKDGLLEGKDVQLKGKAIQVEAKEGGRGKAAEENVEEEVSSEGIKDVCACEVLEEENMFHYDMFSSYFKNVEKPEVTCGLCKMTGHIRASCMAKKTPTILPAPTEEHLLLVNNIITNILYDFTPIESDVENRALVVEEVKRPVESVFPEASVEVFGSTMSGFGFFSSDLDICVNFGGEDEKENDESRLTKKRLRKVAGIMFRLKTFTNIQVITSARVPIIKLRHIETQVDLDISIDNCLAIHNTRLLLCYSKIDERVRILGLAVKVFAKACEINDASLGSLSSYTYILMMLHYLQQCQPPVIPVLQELYPGGKKPETKQFMVSGCNVWFFDDLKRLPKVWAGCGQNGQSVGELWLGFLRYYVNHFDWKNTAVSIRQTQLLTKFEKRWTGPCLAVEDPFDLNRNLGRNLALWVNDCIFYTFQCGALHFWTPLDANKKQFERFESLSDYFFDMDLLTGGSSASEHRSESYCPACHERGHTFRVCPEQSFLPGQKTACHWFILLLCRRRKGKKKKEAPVKKEQPGKQAGKNGKAAQATGASKKGNTKLAAPDTKNRKKTKSSADRPKTSEQTESSNPEATVKQLKSRKQAKSAVNKSKACEDNASSRPEMTVDNGKTGKKTKSSDDRPRSGTAKLGSPQSSPHKQKTPNKTKFAGAAPETCEQPESVGVGSPPPVKQKTPKKSKSAGAAPETCEQPESGGVESPLPVKQKTPNKTKSAGAAPETCEQPESGGVESPPPVKLKTPKKSKSPGAAPETCEQPESGGVGSPPPVKQKTPKKSKSAGAAPETIEQPESGGVGLPPPVKQKTSKKSKSAGAAPETCEQPESGGVGSPPPVKQKTPKKSKSAGAGPGTCELSESGGVGLPPPVKQKTPKKSKSAGDRTCPQTESGASPSPLHAQSGDKGPVATVYFALGDSGDHAHMVESDIVQIAGAKARILVKPSKWE